MAGSNQSTYTEWIVQLVDKRTKRPIDDDSGLFTVLTAGDPSAVTCYSDGKGTALTLPATMTNGVMKFYTAAATTTVDLSILTAAGRSYFIEALTPSQHHIEVDTEKQEYTFITYYSMNTACGAVADTGFNLIAGMKVDDVYVHKTDASTGLGLDVGLSGDTDGFLDNATASVTGWEMAEVKVSEPTANIDNVNAAQIRGVLLGHHATGLDTLTGGAAGWFARKAYSVTAATSLVYVVANTNSGGTGKGYIYVEYKLRPTQGN